MTLEEQMRHDAITQYLDAAAKHHKAKALLDDLEPSCGGRAALEAEVSALRKAAIALAVPEMEEVPVSSGGGSIALFAALVGMGCAAYVYVVSLLARRWM